MSENCIDLCDVTEEGDLSLVYTRQHRELAAEPNRDSDWFTEMLSAEGHAVLRSTNPTNIFPPFKFNFKV